MLTTLALLLCAADPAAAAPARAPAPAAAPADDERPTLVVGDLHLTPTAQLRIRPEWVPDRTLVTSENAFIVTHRARAGMKASIAPFDLVISVQDVRAWGSERVPEAAPPDPTVFGKTPDSLGVFEAYVGFHLDPFELRVGRQTIAFANERLLGRADFGQNGRAFNAARVISTTDQLTWTAFAALVSDAGAPGDLANVVLAGANAETKLTDWARLSPTLLYDARLAAEIQRVTFGARVDGTSGAFGYDVDMYAQTTREADAAIRPAMMLGARTTWTFADTPLSPKVGLVVDALSGERAPGVGLAAFNTIDGTNHGFYGFADIFTNLPLHTKGQGLVDAAANVWVHEGPWSGVAAFHVFGPFDYVGPDAPLYGVEPDIVGTWKPTKNISLEAGCAIFVPTGRSLGRGDQTATWAYSQLNVWL
jgi:hypothetical protein